jgi:2-polyprenyl-6-methoxyphenol hydroxylase-like FAD-dependent oxidoreductase
LTGLINRWKLREALAKGLPIEWNKKFTHYEEKEDSVTAYFEDGTSIEADILIGADGAKSRVRKQRAPTVEYKDLGIRCSHLASSSS